MRPRLTIATQVAQSLRERIDRGDWAGTLPAELALSRQMQVSRATLRAALRLLHEEGRVRIAHGRATEILASADADSSAGDNGAASPKRSRTIAMITPRVERNVSAWYNAMIEELLLSLQGTGYQLAIHSQPSHFRRAPIKSVSNLVSHAPAACWILGGVKAPVQRWFAQQRIPAIVAGSNHPGVDLPSVDCDFEAVAFHAVRMCVAYGHRHVALVTPRTGLAGEEATRRGFLKAVAPEDATKIRLSIWPHDATVPSVRAALERGLASSARERPTALLVVRGEHALTVLTHLMRMGLKVPDDVVVISRDNEVMLEYLSPSLASYHLNPAEYARHLFRAVMQVARGRPLHNPRVLIAPRFHRGEMLPAAGRRGKKSGKQTS